MALKKLKLSPPVRKFAERMEAMLKNYDVKHDSDLRSLFGGCQTELYDLYFKVTAYSDNDGTVDDEKVIDRCVTTSVLLMKLVTQIVVLEKKLSAK